MVLFHLQVSLCNNLVSAIRTCNVYCLLFTFPSKRVYALPLKLSDDETKSSKVWHSHCFNCWIQVWCIILGICAHIRRILHVSFILYCSDCVFAFFLLPFGIAHFKMAHAQHIENIWCSNALKSGSRFSAEIRMCTLNTENCWPQMCAHFSNQVIFSSKCTETTSKPVLYCNECRICAICNYFESNFIQVEMSVRFLCWQLHKMTFTLEWMSLLLFARSSNAMTKIHIGAKNILTERQRWTKIERERKWSEERIQFQITKKSMSIGIRICDFMCEIYMRMNIASIYFWILFQWKSVVRNFNSLDSYECITP